MSIGLSDTSGFAGFVRSVTQIGRPLPTSRVNVYRPGSFGPRIGPSHSWSLRRAGPPVQMYLQSWMQLDVWPDGRLTKLPICFISAGFAYEMT